MYIPGPQYTKSTGYKSNLTVGTLKEMQVNAHFVKFYFTVYIYFKNDLFHLVHDKSAFGLF